MRLDNMISAIITETKQKLIIFCKGIDENSPLSPENYLTISNGLKESLAAGGIAGLRTFLKSHDSTEDKVLLNGQTLYRKPSSIKEYLSPFGIMNLERNVYQRNKGEKVFIPIDVQWGMVDQFATSDVRDAILFGSSDLSPVTAEAFFKRSSLFHPSHTAIENIINKAGDFLEENGNNLIEQVRTTEKLSEETRVIVESIDGANVRLREPGVKKGRPVENPGKDNSKETASCFKNAMVGSISFYGELDPETSERKRVKASYTARMPEDRALTFKNDFEAESKYWQKHMDESIIRMTLTDGALGIWTYLENDPNYANIPKLLDFYHATEHLGSAAEALFGKNNREGRYWYSKWKRSLKENEDAASKICRSIEYYVKSKRLGKARRYDAEKQLTFFKRNRKRMNYLEFINKGLPIGSGPVEAACKSIVKYRMCKSGMRWSRQGGQPILSIRSIVKSKRWDQFWKLYVSKQHEQMQLAS